MPARVILQDFTGVPAVVDLAAMRGGGEAPRRRPEAGSTRSSRSTWSSTTRCRSTSSARRTRCGSNAEIEFERNRERYEFLRWGQKAFAQLPRRAAGDRHRPPGQPRVPRQGRAAQAPRAARRSPIPDTLVGTDSHTTMINGLGVLGWGVGGIEAEAVMLGQPLYMLTPQVVGFRLHGRAARGRAPPPTSCSPSPRCCARRAWSRSSSSSSAPGSSAMSLADRATIANMAPEYGATWASSRSTTRRSRYLRRTGRSRAEVDLRRALHARSRGSSAPTRRPTPCSPTRSSSTSARVEPSLAGPEAAAGPRAALPT